MEPTYKKLEKMMLFQLPRYEAAEKEACRQRDAAMEAFDAQYAKALLYVDGVLRLAGFGDTVCDPLRPYSQRRQMSRWARARREARARAKTVSQQAVRSVTRVSSWLGLRRVA